MFVFYSAEEAGQYLETYKTYEEKPADMIKDRTESDFLSQVKIKYCVRISLKLLC